MANGLYSNEELIDTLIIDCNNAVKSLVSGQYIAFCVAMGQMVQKLGNLKIGVAHDLRNREENIEMLEKRLADLGHPVQKITTDELLKKEGESNG